MFSRHSWESAERKLRGGGILEDVYLCSTDWAVFFKIREYKHEIKIFFFRNLCARQFLKRIKIKSNTEI